jgi:uncharacterized protein YceK
MSVQTLNRCGVAPFFVALISGCSSVHSPASSGTSGRGVTSNPMEAQCRSNPRSCLYNGQYEPGERDYAEQEAKRLNQLESARLRRSFGE